MALQELLDRNELQRLQDEFCKVAGVSAYCLDHEGIKLTRVSGDDRYLHCAQERMAFERVQGKYSLEDLAVEDLDGQKQVAALAIRARGEKELYWMVYRPEGMSARTFDEALDLLRDASIIFLQGKIQSFGAEADNIRNQSAHQKMGRNLQMIRAMGEIVQLLESREPIEGILNEWLGSVSTFLELDTAQIFKLQEDDKYMDVICEWRSSNIISFFDRTSRIDTQSFLKVKKPLVVNADRITQPEFRSMYNLGLKAVMIFPICPQEGNGSMVLSLNHRRAYAFSEEEEKFAADAVRVLENILIRRIQKNSLISSYASLEAILDNVNTCIYVRDEQRNKTLFANKLLQRTFAEELRSGTFKWILEQIGTTAEAQAQPGSRRTDEVSKDSEAKESRSGDLGQPGDGRDRTQHAEEMAELSRRAKEAVKIEITELDGGKEIYYEAKDRWYDMAAADIRWVDGRRVRMYSLYDITERKHYQGRIEQQAYTDFLTGLYNRMCCERDLAIQIDSAKKQGRIGALLYLDLDDFKHINDGLGHQYGDVLLKAISHAFQRIAGIERTCYRMGGDEFVIVVSPEAYEDFERILDEIGQIFNKPWFLKDSDYYCTMSMGVVTFPENGESVPDLVKKADIAMYAAKKGGKNRIEFYSDSIDSSDRRRLDMEKNMRDATAKNFGEFEVYYQPIIDVQEGRSVCAGAEALIRWNSSHLGFVTPMEFIPLAEYLGLINPIGNHVLLEACKTCKKWNDMGFDYKINVNLSVVQLLQRDIVDIVDNALKGTGLSPEHLTLEVTESLAINDMERMKRILGKIRELGVKLALDDFGTGYSSLNHIREIPFDVIKVDQSFVKELAEDAYSQSFIKLVSELAETIGMSVCVEGIESSMQYQVLQDMRVKYIQGYYFDKPMNRKSFEEKYCRAEGLKKESLQPKELRVRSIRTESAEKRGLRTRSIKTEAKEYETVLTGAETKSSGSGNTKAETSDSKETKNRSKKTEDAGGAKPGAKSVKSGEPKETGRKPKEGNPGNTKSDKIIELWKK